MSLFTKLLDNYSAAFNRSNLRYNPFTFEEFHNGVGKSLRDNPRGKGLNNEGFYWQPSNDPYSNYQESVVSAPSRTTGGGYSGSSIISPTAGSGQTVNDYGVDMSVYDKYSAYLENIMAAWEAQNAKEREAAEAQNAWQAEQNRIAMDFNMQEAQKNRDWQQMMSNTAHQREVQDLMAAGLNPVLSAAGGNGAAVTSGATASGVTSSGAKANVDNTFVLSLLSFLNNMMGYATSTAAAGISAGGLVGAAGINAAATQYAADMSYKNKQDNPDSIYGLFRRLLDTAAGDLGVKIK